MPLVVALVAVLLPFVAGAHLCVGAFSSVVIYSGEALARIGARRERRRPSELRAHEKAEDDMEVLDRAIESALSKHGRAAEPVVAPSGAPASGEAQEERADVRHTGAAAPPATGGSDLSETLRSLKRLKDEGLISNEEFEEKRKQILDRI